MTDKERLAVQTIIDMAERLIVMVRFQEPPHEAKVPSYYRQGYIGALEDLRGADEIENVELAISDFRSVSARLKPARRHA